ncbi:MAG: twin-arginine translocase TatA/TatE family subunit [Smithella sp.]|jgi:sec-independent protein translocase protein TatA
MLEINIKELLVILVIVLIIFCAGKLPEIGCALDKGIKNLKKSVYENNDINNPSSKKEDEKK